MLYNFSSFTLKKNEVLLNENEIIEEIIFIKDGRLSLELPINIKNPEESVNQFFGEEFMNFAFKFHNDFKFAELNLSKHSISSLLEERRESQLFHFKEEKLKNNENSSEEEKLIYLKIYDLPKNEDYGGIYMFYGKRSPFKVRVRTKRVKLYTIKRNEYSTICESYKNIIKFLDTAIAPPTKTNVKT